MTDARTLDAVKAAADPMEALGATYMLHEETFGMTAENGYPHPFAGYMVGRGGMLGDVPAETIVSVFQVFQPDAAKQLWDLGVGVHGAKKGCELYFEQINKWGAKHLAGAPNLDRIIELGQKVIDATPGNGLPLYAGWKTVPPVSDKAGRALQVIMTLRELRGSVHNACVTAVGLSPVESHLLNKGAEYCAIFGWPEPFPSVDHLKDKRAEAEELTNQRMAEIWGNALTADEAAELAELAGSALKTATS